MDVGWWGGFVLNVLATFFLLGDLLSEESYERLLIVCLLLGSLSVAVVVSLQAALHGSMVNLLAGYWGRHSTLRLGFAAALLASALPGFAFLWRASSLRRARWLVGLFLVFYAVTIVRILTAIPFVYPGTPTDLPMGLEWVREQPSLAIHWVYATASLWGVYGMVFLPLIAGRWSSHALARAVRTRTVVRWVNIGVFAISWALQVTGAL